MVSRIAVVPQCGFHRGGRSLFRPVHSDSNGNPKSYRRSNLGRSSRTALIEAASRDCVRSHRSRRFRTTVAPSGATPVLNRSGSVTSRAFASFTRFSSDGFRNALSIPARYVLCMSASSASFSCDHLRSRRSSRRRAARARFACGPETKRSSCDFVDYESIEYK